MSAAHIAPAHIASAMVDVPAAYAFAYLRDIECFSGWSLGCLETREDEAGIWHGRSLFDGAQTCCRLDIDEPRLLIDFHVGASPDKLSPRISARVVPGPILGADAATCLVTLTAYRSATMSDERWRQLQAAHDCEIHLIKGQLER